jgi:hypothetical protein
MILVDNIQILMNRFETIWEQLQLVNENSLLLNPEIIQTNGDYNPTLVISRNGKQEFIHSKYDPNNEAERWMGQYESLEDYNHVLIYGIGLGYHIDALIKKFPTIRFSIFEPKVEVLQSFLSERSLNEWPLNLLDNIYLGNEISNIRKASNYLIGNPAIKVLLMTCPSYERIFKEEFQQFISVFQDTALLSKTVYITNINYERLWTINSLANLPKILETDNIIKSKKVIFKGVPIILVAAGPSLQDELENLRYIKENGLAYIFSVGSAIKSLVANHIYPDAACTYDPNLHNFKVFEDIVNQNITTIPLVFGSSVGYETLEKYPGPLLHMILNQDTVSQYYLGKEQIIPQEIINDAPTIAIVTLNLLIKLGCSSIILVGQNFGFRNNQYYSSGIQYTNRSNELTEKEQSDLILYEGADGGEITSNKGFIDAKIQMELYLGNLPAELEIINSTKGGAKIAHTRFVPLSELIETTLKQSIVIKDWHKKEDGAYELSNIQQNKQLINREFIKCKKIYSEILSIFRGMDSNVKSRNMRELEKLFPKFDKLIFKFFNNLFFQIYIEPMTRVQREILKKYIVEIQKISNIFEKAPLVIEQFGKYIFTCEKESYIMYPFIQETHKKLVDK